MPADVKRSVGSSRGTRGAIGRCLWLRSTKNFKNVRRSSLLDGGIPGSDLEFGFGFVSGQIPDGVPGEAAAQERRLEPPPAFLGRPCREPLLDLGRRRRRPALLRAEFPLGEVGIVAKERVHLREDRRGDAPPLQLRLEQAPSLRLSRQLSANERAQKSAVVQKRDAAEALDGALHRVRDVSAL